jgi:SPP1 family predicted phage head-tail adaptor
MAVGSMRFKLQLQSPTRTLDDGGGATIVWTKVADVFASITPKGSNEQLFADKLRDKLDSVIRIRYRTGITTAYRLVQTFTRDGVTTTRTFEIGGILNVDNRFKFLDLDVSEGVPT